MPVALRNLKTGPTVFSIPDKNIAIEWAGANDPSGGDIQEVDDETMKNRNLRRAIKNGVFEHVSEDEANEAFDAQVDYDRDRRENAYLATTASIKEEANNDILSLKCQGPASRGKGECGADVAVRDRDQGDAPILCSKHSHLASQFIEIETGKMLEKGDSLVPEKKWVAPTIGDRETDRN